MSDALEPRLVEALCCHRLGCQYPTGLWALPLCPSMFSRWHGARVGYKWHTKITGDGFNESAIVSAKRPSSLLWYTFRVTYITVESVDVNRYGNVLEY